MATIADLTAMRERELAMAAETLTITAKAFEQNARQRADLIDIAFKAVELGEMLGADAKEPGRDQLLVREIRDGLVRLAGATA